MSIGGTRLSFTLWLGSGALLAAGCSASGTTSGTPATLAQTQRGATVRQATRAVHGNVAFAISFTPNAKRRRIGPQYVSPSSESLRIDVDGKSAVTIDLLPLSTDCPATPNAPGSYTCTASLYVTGGEHVFTVTAYDSTGGTGNVLSSNTTGSVYVNPVEATTVFLVLEGVVRNVVLTLATTNPPAGKAAAIALTVVARDADGNLIVGPAAYDNPVTLTTTNATAGPLSKTVLNSPADTAGLTVNYTGANVDKISYGATAAGLSSGNVIGAVLTPGAASAGFTEFPIPTGGSYAEDITAGPDGALWFTEGEAGKIGRITTAGSITEYPILSGGAYSFPGGITAGPDGALWFTEDREGPGYIGRISTAGVITEYLIPSGFSQPMGIAAGPDGALWFTEFGNNGASKIGRITTGGTITEFSTPEQNSGPQGITAGPDGALWFTEDVNTGVAKIGRVTVGGSFSEYVLAPPFGTPAAIVAGPDGALWFDDPNANQIGRITTAGSVTAYPIATAGSEPFGLADGPDGALWFAQPAGGQPSPVGMIGRITTGGAITELPVPTPAGFPAGITAGPDGAIWFTEAIANKIGRLQLP